MRSLLLAAVLSLVASIAVAEEEYFLKIEFIGYEQQKQPPEKDSVFSSLELLVQPGRPFHIESTKEDWSTLAKGHFSKTNEGSFLLEIEYERKSSSRGQSKAQTTATLIADKPHVLGGIYSNSTGNETHFSKEAVRVTVQVREYNNSADARTPRNRPRIIQLVPVRETVPTRIEEGMRIDALEHELRFKKTIREQGNLPTTFERSLTEPPSRIREFFRDPPRK